MISPVEQYMISTGKRLFKGFDNYEDVHRLVFDIDDDGDSIVDSEDSHPLDKFLCSDTDGDTCDECSSGTYNVADDA